MSADHGQFSGIAGMTRAKHAKSIEREIDKALAAVDAERRERADAERALRAVRRTAESARIKFTADDLAGAEWVRDRFGWHRVIRVSAKSVTVETGYSWTDRLAIDKILEFRI